jgi:hypothetical protein
MSMFGPEDAEIHVLADDQARYQESWWVQWHDADSSASGALSLRFDRSHNSATVEVWSATDGEVTSHRTTVPFDGSSASSENGFAVGGLSMTTIEPLRSFAVTIDGVGELRYDADVEAFQFSMSGQRVTLRTRHYESVGTVRARLRINGRDLDVRALAFHRHEWGVSAADVRPVHRVQVLFAADLFLSASEYHSPTGRHPLGYLFAAGEYYGIEKIRVRTAFDEGGVARSCDLLIATADRRDFRIPGVVSAATQPDGPVFANFQLAGRQGGGTLIVAGADGAGHNSPMT